VNTPHFPGSLSPTQVRIDIYLYIIAHSNQCHHPQNLPLAPPRLLPPVRSPRHTPPHPSSTNH
jgi:hypothetical protein